VRVWIDTDIGDNPDDSVALLCAAAHPRVDLVGVSTVDGDHARRAARVHELVDAAVTRGDDNSLARVLADARPEVLLAIGPLTNVASLVAGRVELPRLAVMGGLLGTVTHRGERQQLEHNFARDPRAASIVLAACAPVLVVPLDVTVAMRPDEAQLRRLVAAAPVLAPEIETWQAGLASAGIPADARRVCLHDPLALLALTDPTLVRIERRALDVGDDGQLTDSGSAPLQEVVRAVDAPGAVERIVGLLARAVG